jgi:hypothetical protein
MAHSNWTHCMQCGRLICGVEILEAYPIAGALCAHNLPRKSHA